MNNTQFNIEVGTSLNTQGASKALSDFVLKAKKVRNIIDLGDGYKQFDVLTKYVDKAGNSFERFNRVLQDGNGEYVTLNTNLRNITESHQGVTRVFKTSTQEIDKMGRTITTTTDSAKNLKTVVTQWKNRQGELITNTRNYNLATGEMTSSIRESSKGFEKANVKVQKLTASTRTATKAQKSLGQSFVATIAKVAKFYVATLPIQAVQKTITQAVQSVKEFDDALVEFKKVTTLANEDLNKYIDNLGELGKTVARTKTEMVDIATQMRKAGFTEEDSATLAKLVALYQNTADEELTASEASSVLVSQIKAFNYTAQDAIHITDAINQVSQDFAVSSGDIGRGLTSAGSALSTYGNSFDEVIGLITAGENFLPVTD